LSITLFTGCSYTAGNGFSKEKDQPELWVNLLHKNTKLNNTQLLNASRGGRSNAGIFQDTVYNLTNYADIKTAFVCFTDMPRYELSVGLELYGTDQAIIPNLQYIERNLNDVTYSKDYLHKVFDRFVALAHLHYEILNLVYYINSLVKLAKLTKTKIYFINAICPWDKDYFVKLNHVLPYEYTNFTRKIINVDNRSDDEIYKIYDKIHLEYNQAGGIQCPYWINLYDSMRKNKIDVNDDGVHPGIQSNYYYYKQFSEIIC
jgi:hypothetical protein